GAEDFEEVELEIAKVALVVAHRRVSLGAASCYSPVSQGYYPPVGIGKVDVITTLSADPQPNGKSRDHKPGALEAGDERLLVEPGAGRQLILGRVGRGARLPGHLVRGHQPNRGGTGGARTGGRRPAWPGPRPRLAGRLRGRLVGIAVGRVERGG